MLLTVAMMVRAVGMRMGMVVDMLILVEIVEGVCEIPEGWDFWRVGMGRTRKRRIRWRNGMRMARFPGRGNWWMRKPRRIVTAEPAPTTTLATRRRLIKGKY